MSEFQTLCSEVSRGDWPTLGPQFRKANVIQQIAAHLAREEHLARAVPTAAERQAARREAFNEASESTMKKAMEAFEAGTMTALDVAAMLARVHRAGDRFRL
jgi:hypothetical protein